MNATSGPLRNAASALIAALSVRRDEAVRPPAKPANRPIASPNVSPPAPVSARPAAGPPVSAELPPGTGESRQVRAMFGTPQSLAAAFIAAEILAKPVALRER